MVDLSEFPYSRCPIMTLVHGCLVLGNTQMVVWNPKIRDSPFVSYQVVPEYALEFHDVIPNGGFSIRKSPPDLVM